MSGWSEKFKVIADKIREKLGTTDLIAPKDFASKIDDVYDAGRTDEWNAFWDEYQDYGNRRNYDRAFANNWKDSIFRPKYDIRATATTQVFQHNNQITNLKKLLQDANVTFDTSNTNGCMQMFQGCSQLTNVPTINISGVTKLNTGYMFQTCTKLIEIEKLIVDENTGYGTMMFYLCTQLVTLIFEGVIGENGLDIHWSNQLSHESLMSIINCLKDYSQDTSGTQWIVTIGATNLAKLTSEEKAIATQKGWTLAA